MSFRKEKRQSDTKQQHEVKTNKLKGARKKDKVNLKKHTSETQTKPTSKWKTTNMKRKFKQPETQKTQSETQI